MQPFHVLILPGKEPVLRKGAPKPVSITQEIRQGRKTVTKVVGVEQYDIDVVELCKELTKLCASSATRKCIFSPPFIYRDIVSESWVVRRCAPWFKSQESST